MRMVKLLNFLKQVEGYKENYYIPMDANKQPLEHSGVTIGLGIDLGAQNKKSLLEAGLERSTLYKIQPAIGKRKYEALSIKNILPPLTEYEVLNLSLCVLDNERLLLEKKLHNVWLDLPESVQIVAMSLLHQFGNKFFTYRAFSQIKNKEYKNLINNLRDFGCKYPTRRNKEADLIQGELYEK